MLPLHILLSQIKAMKKLMKNIAVRFFIVSALVLCGKVNRAQSLTVNGSDWIVSKNPVTITEAGLDYTGSYESTTDQIKLTISFPDLSFNASANVNAQLIQDPLWHNSLSVKIKRTGGGTITPGACVFCSISGGTSYVTINTVSNVKIFSLTGGLAAHTYHNIPIQINITGVSVAIPVANYKAKIVFTLMD